LNQTNADSGIPFDSIGSENALERLGVNDEGIPVILDLVEQLHGLRRTLRDLLSAIHAQPEAMRRWIIADLRAAVLDRTDGAAQEGLGSDEHQER
jgi:chaperone modulatory protein CbpM